MKIDKEIAVSSHGRHQHCTLVFSLMWLKDVTYGEKLLCNCAGEILILKDCKDVASFTKK